MLPKLTQQFDLTPEDFTRHAVWISVHNYDSDEAWYDDADEETFRPWMGVLPFGEHRGMALAKAIFKLADGTVHPGYFTTESSQWDNARLSGTRRRPPPADILHRQCPTIFVNNGAFDFQLREPHLRDAAISNFFSAIGKKPGEVFPVRFATDGELTIGPSSGTIESFYKYDEVRSALEFAAVSCLWGAATRNVSPSATAAVPVVSQGPTVIDPDLVIDLAKADFERFPVWLKVRHADTVRPSYAQFGFVPWRGTIPVESGLCDARIAASFFLSDGSLLFGCVKPIQEIWEEIVCPSTVLPGGAIIPGITPRVRYGGSPMAIVEQHQCPAISRTESVG